ncbi:DHA2 family efflux MFS transporter permease subunit [Pectinatus haikarae]|uniref:EmrB/QacA subfamily drug resistance transporter n=1 Tax=Pectinatus haikarae TaxID=349096 RepID=A0ABT9YCP2_9FIRM|nr:DHA2 family efflux MFS transporter permease subunit [Pectinatus haikarae]MDQ0204839.1 EmrB/QacA subfamily drug resistance transporter [Pectinatus haikarae]
MENYERKIDTKLIMSIIATGIMAFTGVVIETAMNVTFPTLMREFQINTSTVQWLTTGYLLILSVIIPASSYFKKNFTLKSLFITAEIFFTAGTILDAFAPSFFILLSGRILQGFGAGIALPLMFNIVLDQVPLNHLGTMMGAATLIIAISPAVGPSFGGFIINYWGWRMIFIALLPLLAAAFFVGVFSIRSTANPVRTPFDWPGFLLLSISFSCLIFAAGASGNTGWNDPFILGAFFICIMTFIIFYKYAGKSAHPIFYPSVFHIRTFTLSVIVIGIVQFLCLGLGFLIPNYSQLVSGEKALVAGLLLLPGCIIGAFITPLSGRIMDRIGARKPIIIGNICMIAATFLYSILAQHLTTMLFVLIYTIFTIGQGFSSGTSMTNGLRQLPAKLRADGNAVCTTFQQLSGAIGTAVVSALISAEQKRLPDQLPYATMLGSQNALFLLFILACAALICSVIIFRDIKKLQRS